ncbi:MAG: PD-(D/E)XK nuclease family protein [Bacteroidales bacterium]|jgi:CRISPR/Cas system-associated exonuclease Cas4 (RecB family)|nr:PD-(D/E)XK nuclease family protein [Bacteroidales bacterium]
MLERKSFLSEIAGFLHNTYKESLADICIVMPTNRGIVHLKHYLVSEVGKTFLSPDFFSIEQFMQTISGLSPISPEELIIKLFLIHKEINTSETEAFYDFAPTAQVILQDFNEIDLSLATPAHVFSDLSSIKSLSYFGKTEEELSAYQRYYLNFFKQLYTYYERLSQVLLQEKKAYQGLIYRKAFESKEYISKLFPYKKYVFIGFNALQNSEYEIVKYLINDKKADFYVDADEWYLNNNNHEAGQFLRQIKNDFHLESLQFVGKYIETIPKNVNIVGFPQKCLQATYLHEIIKDVTLDGKENTAIVLADESLLLPVVYSMDVTDANITMGLPIRNSEVYKLLNQYFITIENKQKLNSHRLYHKDLYAFFTSSYIQSVLVSASINPTHFLSTFINKGKLFYSKNELNDLCQALPASLKEFLLSFFDETMDAPKLVQYLDDFLKLLNHPSIAENDKEIIRLLSDNLSHLLSVCKQIENENIKSFRMLFDYFVSSISLSFKSDTFNHLQLMGMLETRTLDFDNVIILSLNEGVLPAGKQGQSFIPYDVRLHYKIPTYAKGEAIFSYHFYRLLQRAKRVFLLYDLDNQDGKAEKSRFIKQIQSEWKMFDHIHIEDSIRSYPPIHFTSINSICVQKTADIMSKLLAIPNFSPSMLNRYLNCELQFYLHDVLALAEEKSISEDMQANVIGSVIHKILEKIIKDIDGNTLHFTNDVIEKLVMDTFCDTSVTNLDLAKEDFMFEKNHLVYKITVKYITDYLTFLKEQMANNEISAILASEKRYYHDLFLTTDEFAKKIPVKGIIDRLDIADGVVRVLDYKTGSVDDKDIKIKQIEDLFSGKYPKAFQLMVYAYIYYLETGQSPLMAQIISFRNIRQLLYLQVNNEKLLTPSLFDAFEIQLKELIKLIFDETKCFSQTTETNQCMWCDYKSLCMRE